MKKSILLFVIGLCPSLFSYSQTLENNAESGDKEMFVAQCWEMQEFSVSDHSSTLISGNFSFRSNELNNASLSASWLKTPWLQLNNGNITFKTKLDGSPGGNRSIIVQYIPFEEKNSGLFEGAPKEFYRFEYPNPINKNIDLYNVSIPVPSNLVNGQIYKILFSFTGTGGSARAGMDEVILPGIYQSDPSNQCLPVVAEKDADGDGVVDLEDDFPNDPFKAYNNNFPAKGFGTLMFEDLWPGIGDYDFNDLVIDYRINRITDSQNEVVEAIIELKTRAIGAGFKNGFGIEFTHIEPNKVLEVVGSQTSPNSIHTFAGNGLEAGTKWATIIPYDNAFKLLPHPGGGVTGVNTDPSGPQQEVKIQTIVVTFKKSGKASSNGPIHLKELGPDNFNPFLIRNQDRKVEIHLPGKTPTDLADPGMFGTIDDNSNFSSGIFYQSKDTNLPWALHVNQSIPYMVEKDNITTGYMKFTEWVTSKGTAYMDWYLDLSEYRNKNKIY